MIMVISIHSRKNLELLDQQNNNKNRKFLSLKVEYSNAIIKRNQHVTIKRMKRKKRIT